MMDAAAPALEMLSRPAAAFDAAADRVRGFITVYRDNIRLAEENERLLGWQQVALKLSAENAELRDLSKLVSEPALSFVTARVIADSGGAYARSVMVNAGRDNGVARGQAAMTGEGLVGRVAEVGSRAARILLITDLNSRVPVVVDGTRERAILAGDNSARPSLRYADAGGTMRIGDRIVTSGQGGVFPRGLPVGVVASVDSNRFDDNRATASRLPNTMPPATPTSVICSVNNRPVSRNGAADAMAEKSTIISAHSR